MGQSRGESRCRRRLVACATAAVAVSLSSAAPALAAPAVDQYGSRLPHAGGNSGVGTSNPKPNPAELPTAVRKQVEKSPAAPALSSIATADELGAPPPVAPADVEEVDPGDGRGVPAAAFSTLGDPVVLLVLLGLAAITALIALATRSARRGEAGGRS